jgi:hypothetical protein
MSETKLKQGRTSVGVDQRLAGPHEFILPVGLLEQEGRSIFCLVKNISATGVQVKPYGDVFEGAGVSLRIDDERIPGTLVWSREGLVGVKFRQTLNAQALLRIGQKMVVRRQQTAPRVPANLGPTELRPRGNFGRRPRHPR